MANAQPRLTHRDTAKTMPSPEKDLGRYLLESDERIGGTHGPYCLLGPLGEGGMGQVYLAEHIHSGTLVVVKFSNGGQQRDDHLEGEFNALMHFNHPNILQVHDFGIAHGRGFMVTEYLEGDDLHGLLHRQNLLEPDAAAEIAIQALRALEAVHDAGLLHNDVKPANLLLAEYPDATVVKLIDFGLSTTAEYAAGNLVSFGTPLYMSPELVSASALDHRSDLYSVGVTLYRMLSGNDLFSGTNSKVLGHTLRDPPTPLVALVPDIPRDLERIVSCALEKDPAKRFRSAISFREALQDALDNMDQARHSDVRSLVELDADRSKAGVA